MRRRTVIALLVLAGIGIFGIGAVVGSGSDSDGGTTGTRNHSSGNGAMTAMLERHQAMMEQMRAGVTPEMLRLMDADPMWKAMRTDEFATLMEEHQDQIDRMLGLAPGD